LEHSKGHTDNLGITQSTVVGNFHVIKNIFVEINQLSICAAE